MTFTRRRFVRTAAGLAVGTALAKPLGALAQSAPKNDGGSTFGAAEWMRIPRISVDSHITDVGVIDGYYDVPWFDIGHHIDSVQPGDLGNSLFNGHVVTVNAGEVFRHLDQLQPGDAVYVYTADFRLDWVATDVYTVAQDDNSFLANSDGPRITLYTCTGNFNPVERNYAERFVVQGQLVNVGPRTS
jgi:LPXTG-site transpeptidase (sortase) family protein